MVNPPPHRREIPSQVVANVECVPRNLMQSSTSAKFDEKDTKIPRDKKHKSTSSLQKKGDSTRTSSGSASPSPVHEKKSIGSNSCEALELNIQEILALDVEYTKKKDPRIQGHHSKNGDKIKKNVFKSLPNLSASSENLLE